MMNQKSQFQLTDSQLGGRHYDCFGLNSREAREKNWAFNVQIANFSFLFFLGGQTGRG